MVQPLRTLCAVAIAIIAGAWSHPAVAQEITGGATQQLDPNRQAPPSPAPDYPHFTREQAEALLATWEAAEQFEVAALEDNRFGLRHRGSGMICRFAPDFQNRINLRRPGQPNSDVGCVSGPWPETMLAAARNNLPPATFIATMEQSFREQHPNALPFQANQFWPAPTRDAVYLHLVSQNAAGERSVIHAVAFRHGRWTIFSRMSYTASGDLPIMAAELAAAAHFGSIIADLEED
ncbi:MAG: hypothetical protein NT015_12075 [Alphaproteobacteria bacterium]|nr:hypothetical protein [Alphaproteobacteria bacterium]